MPYLKIVNLEKLKQVHAEQLKTDTEVFPEHHIVFQVNHVHDILLIVVFQELQQFKFYASLVHIFLLVLDDFQAHLLLGLVVDTFESGAETTLAQERKHFEPKSDVVVQ